MIRRKGIARGCAPKQYISRRTHRRDGGGLVAASVNLEQLQARVLVRLGVEAIDDQVVVVDVINRIDHSGRLGHEDLAACGTMRGRRGSILRREGSGGMVV